MVKFSWYKILKIAHNSWVKFAGLKTPKMSLLSVEGILLLSGRGFDKIWPRIDSDIKGAPGNKWPGQSGGEGGTATIPHSSYFSFHSYFLIFRFSMNVPCFSEEQKITKIYTKYDNERLINGGGVLEKKIPKTLPGKKIWFCCHGGLFLSGSLPTR